MEGLGLGVQVHLDARLAQHPDDRPAIFSVVVVTVVGQSSFTSNPLGYPLRPELFASAGHGQTLVQVFGVPCTMGAVMTLAGRDIAHDHLVDGIGCRWPGMAWRTCLS
jgi:hypothetical protein